jgi:hypothetical protein
MDYFSLDIGLGDRGWRWPCFGGLLVEIEVLSPEWLWREDHLPWKFSTVRSQPSICFCSSDYVIKKSTEWTGSQLDSLQWKLQWRGSWSWAYASSSSIKGSPKWANFTSIIHGYCQTHFQSKDMPTDLHAGGNHFVWLRVVWDNWRYCGWWRSFLWIFSMRVSFLTY